MGFMMNHDDEFSSEEHNSYYDSREYYLSCLAEDYGVAYKNLLVLANVLGEDEDYDGLITYLNNMTQENIDDLLH